jgi:hypothetical protein
MPDPVLGLGYGIKSQLRTFPPLRSIPMPNFIEIGLVVWISMPDTHTHTHTLSLSLSLTHTHTH